MNHPIALCLWRRLGNHNGVAVLVFYLFSCHLAAFTHGATLFAHVESDGVGTAGRGGVEVIVHGNEEVAGSYCCGMPVRATPSSNGRLPKSGLSLRPSFRGGLIFAGTAHGEVFAFGGECGSLIAIGRDAKFVSHSLCELAG